MCQTNAQWARDNCKLTCGFCGKYRILFHKVWSYVKISESLMLKMYHKRHHLTPTPQKNALVVTNFVFSWYQCFSASLIDMNLYSNWCCCIYWQAFHQAAVPVRLDSVSINILEMFNRFYGWPDLFNTIFALNLSSQKRGLRHVWLIVQKRRLSKNSIKWNRRVSVPVCHSGRWIEHAHGGIGFSLLLKRRMW